MPEVKRSLVAAGGAALLLPQRVPLRARAGDAAHRRPADAARAAELGLVNRLAAEGGALDGALELAATIAANGPLAVAATKADRPRPRRLDLRPRAGQQQDELIAPVFASEDAREGATAFAEKRPPVWKGR